MRAMLVALLRPHRVALAISLLLLLIQSLSVLAQPWLGGVLANRLVLGEGLGGLLWLLFVLIVLQAALGYLASIQLQAVSGSLVADAGKVVYAHLQALPLAWHNERERGEVLALLTGDVYRLGNFASGTLLPLLPLLLTFFGALLLMLGMAPAIAVAVAVLMPLVFVMLRLVGRKLRPLSHEAMQAWADQSALAEQNLGMLPVIKAFATDGVESDRYAGRVERVRGLDLRSAKLHGIISPTVHVLGAGAVLLLLGIGGRWVVDEQMSVGQLVSLFLYGLVLVGPVSQLASVYGQTQSARGTAQRLRAAMSADIEQDDGTRVLDGMQGRIAFEGLHFAYPGRAPVFDGLDLVIEAGQTIALTGPNGAGKSTLAHLLLRLYEPQAGRITIDGVDIRDLTLSGLRESIGLVSQQVLLFNASLADNIRYGRPDASAEQVRAAARGARVDSFVDALPQGYDTVIGDQGVKLSGGQKQRIALARALLKDPRILVLDEATAMFDPDGEREFIEQCRELFRNATVLLITHRPASLALADRIVRVEGGEVREVGGSG